MIAFLVVFAVVLLFGLVVFRGAPYVPSHQRQVRRAFEHLYPLHKNDVLVDVGSGDGVVLRLASQRGARAIGYELNPLLVAVSACLSRRDPRVTVRLRDFWLTPLPPEVTVVYGFLVSRDTEKMRQKLQGEANRLGKTLHYIAYGAPLERHRPIKKSGAHQLYMFAPLHTDQA